MTKRKYESLTTQPWCYWETSGVLKKRLACESRILDREDSGEDQRAGEGCSPEGRSTMRNHSNIRQPGVYCQQDWRQRRGRPEKWKTTASPDFSSQKYLLDIKVWIYLHCRYPAGFIFILEELHFFKSPLGFSLSFPSSACSWSVRLCIIPLVGIKSFWNRNGYKF